MNKWIAFFCLTVSGLVSEAQITDTLGFANYRAGTETLYSSPNGGYAFGNNGYGDRAKAQIFSHDQSFVIKELQLKFGDVQFASTDSTSSININIYSFGGAGATFSSASDSIAPDSIIQTYNLPVYELNAGSNPTVVDVSSDQLVFQANERFFVGVDFEQLAEGDTVGLYSTEDGDAEQTYRSWELNADSNWVLIAQPAFSWDLDVDLAIFVAIDVNDPSGINDYSETAISVFPNPTSSNLQVDLSELPDGLKNYQIMNSTGSVMLQGFSSKNRFEINTARLSSGVYMLSIESETLVLSKKIIISK